MSQFGPQSDSSPRGDPPRAPPATAPMPTVGQGGEALPGHSRTSAPHNTTDYGIKAALPEPASRATLPLNKWATQNLMAGKSSMGEDPPDPMWSGCGECILVM